VTGDHVEVGLHVAKRLNRRLVVHPGSMGQVCFAASWSETWRHGKVGSATIRKGEIAT